MPRSARARHPRGKVHIYNTRINAPVRVGGHYYPDGLGVFDVPAVSKRAAQEKVAKRYNVDPDNVSAYPALKRVRTEER